MLKKQLIKKVIINDKTEKKLYQVPLDIINNYKSELKDFTFQDLLRLRNSLSFIFAIVIALLMGVIIRQCYLYSV